MTENPELPLSALRDAELVANDIVPEYIGGGPFAPGPRSGRCSVTGRNASTPSGAATNGFLRDD